jgi:hypothetical protein
MISPLRFVSPSSLDPLSSSFFLSRLQLLSAMIRTHCSDYLLAILKPVLVSLTQQNPDGTFASVSPFLFQSLSLSICLCLSSTVALSAGSMRSHFFFFFFFFVCS